MRLKATNIRYAASAKTQNKWVPKGFQFPKGPNRCGTVAFKLERTNKKLKAVRGFCRIKGDKNGWGDHLWCVTPKGSIIDPYFRFRFPEQWQQLEYQADDEY